SIPGIKDGSSNQILVAEVSNGYKESLTSAPVDVRPGLSYSWLMGAGNNWNSSDNRGMNWTTVRYPVNFSGAPLQTGGGAGGGGVASNRPSPVRTRRFRRRTPAAPTC